MARGGKRPGAGRKPGSLSKARPPLPLGEGPDAALAEQVALLVASGMDQADIASAMNITPLELRGRFKRELKHGALIAKAQQIARLAAASAKGNAGASKALLGMIGAADGEDTVEPDDTLVGNALRLLQGGRA